MGLFAFSSGANAETRPAPTADAAVEILRAASAAQAQPLDFGRVLPSPSGGDFAVHPDGRIDCTGGLVCDQRARPAEFRVTGSGEQVAVGVSDAAALVGPEGVTIRLVPMLSTRTLQLSGGDALLTVGGTIAIGPAQPPGRYAGQYEIDIQYQ
ncbi:DUF4402 domain-containing protein [Sphingomonas sp.]|uniref:DUF4402 domain-containing protein n=1 Tax=Sphingomonas sp. TaxID=28214 RepID=UPI001D440682|nr:DUF4402 domain-containing protein [Sphingomonas sp.]MBX9797099.1 DUF4402 domain-containing protein [Sphingomonas sp.]